MEACASDEVRAYVERNQGLIDCILTRRAHDERRCDLYQRIQQAQDAQRRQLEVATAALEKELLSTLEKKYTLDQQHGRNPKGPFAKADAGHSPSKRFDAAERLRASIVETQRFNEALRIEIVKQASRCDLLKQHAQEKEQRCCALRDDIDQECSRCAAHAWTWHTAMPSIPHTRDYDARSATEKVQTLADALLIDTTQFYQRAYAAVRDDVVAYIALQDEFISHLQRAPPPAEMPSSFEASLADSVQLLCGTYTQLRCREQEHYQGALQKLQRLLREPTV
ncbi:hypothetical protein ABL78_4998 [Leptomonas seymouri]|uniref:Uncharacterized protein n=1 Tax=Leptomonas seymouri TaxID=5684 RepID=A0A0N1IK80_LEPSE|nr:hypothetical protein ABL78_4998 [Leptomonas seymouri]|eukprot:KPI85955.1 hypothetical protein ABL78_4998 [Leptomonas seymouri]